MTVLLSVAGCIISDSTLHIWANHLRLRLQYGCFDKTHAHPFWTHTHTHRDREREKERLRVWVCNTPGLPVDSLISQPASNLSIIRRREVNSIGGVVRSWACLGALQQ